MFALSFYSKDRTHTYTKEFHSLWAPHQTNRMVMWEAEAFLSKLNPIEVCSVCPWGRPWSQWLLGPMMCLCECIHKHAASVCAGTCVNENAVCVSVYPHRAVWDFSLNGAVNSGLCWKKRIDKEKEARQRVRATDNIANSPLPVFNWSTKQTIAQRDTERKRSACQMPRLAFL